jgi:hypothetical protein
MYKRQKYNKGGGVWEIKRVPKKILHHLGCSDTNDLLCFGVDVVVFLIPNYPVYKKALAKCK